ncbi:MAG: dienelactone hydrolase family protein [Pseudomonadota bacterium]
MSTTELDGPRLGPPNDEDPKKIVIFCHGYGANGQDLIGLGAEWRDWIPHAVFVSPNAPEPVPGAPGGFQWFSIVRAGALDMELIRTGARKAAPTLNAFIDAELARFGLKDSDLALVGFSQGTMMALHVGLRRPSPPAAIVGYSGLLTDTDGLEGIGARPNPPIMLIHGDQDPVIPFDATIEASDKLTALGLRVRRHISKNVPHGIGPDGVQLAGAFLADRLALV